LVKNWPDQPPTSILQTPNHLERPGIQKKKSQTFYKCFFQKKSFFFGKSFQFFYWALNFWLWNFKVQTVSWLANLPGYVASRKLSLKNGSWYWKVRVDFLSWKLEVTSLKMEVGVGSWPQGTDIPFQPPKWKERPGI